MSPASPLRRGRLAALALAVGLIAALVAGEGLLRALGREPWRPGRLHPGEPRRYEPDLVLGWRAKPGVYRYPVNGTPIRLTRLPDGRRASGDPPAEPRSRLALVGGSFAEGWGLTDEHTLGWKLQQALPAVEVHNHAVGGYGTYQSYLLLDELLKQPRSPDRVIYGFTELHEERNVASPRWLHDLALGAERGTVAVPYVTLGPRGGLRRHAPQAYPRWPLREQLALVSLAERAWVQVRGRGRLEQRHAVTAQLLVLMDRLCRQREARLLVAVLWAPQTRELYTRVLRERGIDVADCALTLRPDVIIPGDGHPNERATSGWTRCLVEALRDGESGDGAAPGAGS